MGVECTSVMNNFSHAREINTRSREILSRKNDIIVVGVLCTLTKIMKDKSIKWMLAASIFASVVGMLYADVPGNDRLMLCPDCGKEVSKRAMMCPACGCEGAIIKAVAKELESKPKPKIPDRVVRANIGREVYDALPVKMTDGLFVVLPLEKVLDIETLEFSFVSTNATINYSIPEVAIDQPIIRFPITETNLLFATAETNVCSELATPVEVKLSSASGWQEIQPRALKNHGKTLLRIKAGEDVKLPPKAHPFYKTLEGRWSRKGN